LADQKLEEVFQAGIAFITFRDKTRTAVRCTFPEALSIKNLPVGEIVKFDWHTTDADPSV
jgi:hypothetical protein